jgi:tetratricopeptide (TPR) repeat protein
MEVGGTDDALEPVGEFIGRDALLYMLEDRTRTRRVTVLHGQGGSGKTELAKAFGRWWRQTGGVEQPDWVFFHSFEPGMTTFGLDGVITAIGLRVRGPDFARLDAAQRQAAVETFLATHRALLIWDNFETVRTMSDESAGALGPPEPGHDAFVAFLARLVETGGGSAVVITSRTAEDWLAREAMGLPVPGLTRLEANQYADRLLHGFPQAQARRAERAFADLMAWLDGHPLSMRLVLPRLAEEEPGTLLDELRGLRTPPDDTGPDGGRTTSLSASLGYSYAHLSARAKALLPAVSLFEGYVDKAVIAAFARTRGVPQRFGLTAADDWQQVLSEAARAGLLTDVGSGRFFAIHPALPAYLASVWRAADPVRYQAEREAAADALCATYAAYADELDTMIDADETGRAYNRIGLHYRTFVTMFRRALDGRRWYELSSMVPPLNAYLSARGLYGDADSLARDVSLATEDAAGRPPHLEKPAGMVWLLNTQLSAQRAVEHGRLDDAEAQFRRILAATRSRGGRRREWWGPKELYLRFFLWLAHYRRGILADTYFGLGSILQDKGQLDEADELLRRSIAIAERSGPDKKADLASGLHHLGLSARARGRLDEAEKLIRKAIELSKEVRNLVGLAASYFELGVTAQCQGRLDEAVKWLLKSLNLRYSFNDRSGVATAYHQLGFVALDRGDLADATDLFTRSLVIREEIDDRPGLGGTLQMLGTVAQNKGDLAEAEQWYAKSLAISEDLGVQTSLAKIRAQLSSLAEEQGDLSRALELAVRSVSLFAEVPDSQTGSAPARLARITGQLGIATLEQTWCRVTGNALPTTVRDYVGRDAT